MEETLSDEQRSVRILIADRIAQEVVLDTSEQIG